MNKVITWKSGLQDFCEKELVLENENRVFTSKLTETDFEPNRDILDIYYDHLKSRDSRTVEVLYSGGVDSELVLLACMKHKIPFIPITMEIRVKDIPINVNDLYYSEKFCRENNLKLVKHILHVEDLYTNGKYIEYLRPYDVCRANVASHFWLIEKCDSFPIFGGDWPWVQVFAEPKVLSPFRYDYHCYERFMKDKGITGIANMISHSYESCYRFMQLQIEHAKKEEQNIISSSFLKQRMYKITKPRIRSYGWESIERAVFPIYRYNDILRSKYKGIDEKIVWQDKTKNLLSTNINENLNNKCTTAL